MSKRIHKDIKTDDQRFIFRLYIETNDAGTEFFNLSELNIFFQKPAPPHKKVLLLQQKDCPLNIPITFTIKDNPQCSNAVVKGEITCTLREGSFWVAGDFYYGLMGQEIHFEGIMCILPMDPDPEPVIDAGGIGDDDLQDIPEPIYVEDSREAGPVGDVGKDLFPYIYMRRWPRISAKDLADNFILYQSSAPACPPVSLLYNRLTDTSMPRRKKENLAIQYINGDFDTPFGFVGDITNLNGTIKFFPAVHRETAGSAGDMLLETLLILIADTLNLWEDNSEENSEENSDVTIPGFLELLRQYLDSQAFKHYLEAVWQSYFALVFVQGYDDRLLEILVQIIVAANMLEKLVAGGGGDTDAETLKKWCDAVIILPADFFISPPSSPPTTLQAANSSAGRFLPVNTLFHDRGMVPYAIGDLQMVKHKFLAYEAGEIAYIESVQKGERKETRRRHLHHVSDSSRIEKDNSNETETVNDRKQGDISTEILKTLTDNTITTDYSDLKATYGTPNAITYGGSLKVTEPETRSEKITKFARDMVDKTVNRINGKVTEIRKHSVRDENEETVVSILDNTGGGSGIQSVYRWLNKVYENCVVNYGNRLMMEFFIRHPAADYMESLRRNEMSGNCRPVSPQQMGIDSYHQINAKDYADYAVMCPGLTSPPQQTRIFSAILRGDEEKMLTIPAGYRAKSLSAAVPVGAEKTITLMVGIHSYSLTGTAISNQPMNHETGDVPAALTGDLAGISASPPVPYLEAAVTLEITCDLLPQTETQWQVDTYNALNKHYREQLRDYSPEPAPGAGPGQLETNGYIMREELVKGCMKLLFAQLFRFNPGEIKEILAVSELRYVQYFQQLFQWDRMYYVFQEDYLTHKDPSSTLLDMASYTGEDRDFNYFLQADYARVVLPVEPAHNQAVLFFLSAGMTWEAGDAYVPAVGGYTVKDGKNTLTPDSGFSNRNHADVEIIMQLKKIRFSGQEGRLVGEPWKVSIPTSLKILQEGQDVT